MSLTWNQEVERILRVGYYLLDEIGISNWALTRLQALKAADELQRLGIPILGGDVCEKIQGKIQPNYDNWLCNQLCNETRHEFAIRSISETKDYINRYLPNSDSERYYFTFTPDD